MALQGSGIITASKLAHARLALSVGAQAIHFIAVNDPRLQGQDPPFGGESVHIPAVLTSLKYDGTAVKILISLERIALIITAGILDSALTVQKRFEHDIDEILTVFAQHKAKRKTVEGASSAVQNSKWTTLNWSGQVLLRGLNLGLRGPLSTQYIGADLVDGYVTHMPKQGGICNKTRWEVQASNLALSLSQESSAGDTLPGLNAASNASFDRTYRLAYFVLDVHAGNRVAEVEELKELTQSDFKEDEQTSHLHVKVAKIHAVMRTAAIEALDDLLEHCKRARSSRKESHVG